MVMVKKLIGILVVAAVIVIIIVAAIRRDSFKSLVERDMYLNGVRPTQQELPKEPWSSPEAVDTTTIPVMEQDTVTILETDTVAVTVH